MEPLKCRLRFLNDPMNPSTGDLQLCRADFIQEERQMSAEQEKPLQPGTMCKNTQPPSAVHKLLHITVHILGDAFSPMWREICVLPLIGYTMSNTQAVLYETSDSCKMKCTIQQITGEDVCVFSRWQVFSFDQYVWIYSTESFGRRESVVVGGETASSTKIHS